MANVDSNLFKKNRRERGTHGGREQTITGVIRLEDGASVATTDLIRVALLGENVRPIRIAAQVVPVSGTPVVTNGTLNIGIAPHGSATFARPDGTEYAPATADADAFVAGLVIPADSSVADIAVTSPAGQYGPYVLTATPAGAGALSVAGGDADLLIAVTFLAEQIGDGFVYEEFVNPNVNNQT